MPAISCPKIRGAECDPVWIFFRSVPQMPHVSIRTSTSPDRATHPHSAAPAPSPPAHRSRRDTPQPHRRGIVSFHCVQSGSLTPTLAFASAVRHVSPQSCTCARMLIAQPQTSATPLPSYCLRREPRSAVPTSRARTMRMQHKRAFAKLPIAGYETASSSSSNPPHRRPP